MTSHIPSQTHPSDTPRDSWIYKLPFFLQPFATLMRIDRLTGVWLLFWPCIWGLTLALQPTLQRPPFLYLFVFGLGSFLMRSAGCIYNDIVDRDFDRQVTRTAGRPLAQGSLTVSTALLLMGVLLFLGGVLLLALPPHTQILGILSLLLVGAYPWMKRITYWPQIFLGLTFNWGILMGYSALKEALSLSCFALYGAGICWTLIYDTVYAHQDKEDDIKIGVKSTALRWAANTKPFLYVVTTLLLGCLLLTGFLEQKGILFGVGAVGFFVFMLRQVALVNLESSQDCLKFFRRNNYVGLLIWALLIA